MKRKIHYYIFMLLLCFITQAVKGQVAESNSGNYWIHATATKYINMDFVNATTGTWMNNGEVWYKGNFTNNGTVDFDNSLVVNPGLSHFEGTNTQILSGSGSTRFYNVLFDSQRAIGAFSLQQNIKISHQADFTRGIVTSSQTTLETMESLMILENGATSVNASDASHVDGFVSKIGNSAFTFPIGNGGYYRQASISAPTNSTDGFTARYIYANPAASGYNPSLKDAGLATVSNNEYWVINRTSGASNVQITLSWDVSKTSTSLSTDLSRLRIVRWNGSMWLSEGNVATSGNTSSGTITANVTGYGVFTLAVTEPVLTAVLDPSSDTGVTGDGKTSDTTPTFSGTGEAGATISVVLGGQTLTTSVAADGTWSVTPGTALTDGSYTATITTTDASGNSATATVPVTIDTTAPAVTAVLDPASDTGVTGDGKTSDTTPTISGTGEAGATISVVLGGQTLTTSVAADGTWSVTPGTALTDGSYTATITTTDASGNSATATVSVNIDTTAPAVTAVLDPASDTGVKGDNKTSDTTPTFSGTGEAGATISVVLGGQTLTTSVAADGTWSVTPGTALTDGSYTATITTTDASGNSATATVPVSIDTTAPAVTAVLDPSSDTGVTGDGKTSDTTPTISGTGEAGATISVVLGGQTLTTSVAADGTWSVTPGTALTDGSYTATITTTDASGNTNTVAVALTVTPLNRNPITTPLSVSTPENTPLNGNVLTNVTDPDGDPISVTGITVNGVNYPAGTIVTIPGVGAMVVNSNGNYTFTPVSNYSGNVPSVAYTVSDGHGGTATGIINITVEFVNDFPVAKGDAVSVAECASVSGSVAGNDTPSKDGGNVWSVKGNPSHGTVTMTADGTYIYIPTPNYHGTDTFTYAITDANGDQSIATVAITVTPLSEKVMIIKQSTQPQQMSDGSFIWKYTIALANLQNVKVDNLQVEDDLTKVFTHGETFKVMSIMASGNLRANGLYDGISHLNTLSDISYLAPMSKDSIMIELKVLTNGYVGNVYNQALFSGFSSRTGQIRDALSDDPSNKESSINGPRATITDVPEVAIYIPEGFSPNNDKSNDTFEIIHSDNTILGIEVFNRWGNRVYHSEEYQGDWDGKGVDNLLGKDLPEGTYYYIVTSTNKKTSEVKKITGYLTLRR